MTRPDSDPCAICGSPWRQCTCGEPLAPPLPTVIISSNEVRSDIPTVAPECCPQCGGGLATGFGLAGGGFGPYTFCEVCAKVTSKTNIEEL